MLAGTAFAAGAHANTLLESSEERIDLVELFTSEGCSSCPPAEAWLGSLRDDSGLWKKFVPVAFHVNYWDYLGWRDPFASEQFTRRQRTYAAEWNSTTVYTPGFVLNGKEWQRTNPLPTPTGEKAGRLMANISEGGTLDVSFLPSNKIVGLLIVEVAFLGQGISTNVKHGENAGKNLQHDFLALAMVQGELVQSASGLFESRLELPKTTLAPVSAVAAWVRSPESLTPIQAVGGWVQP